MGKEKPLVSVIIPVYNTQDYLKACIESVQNQTYPNLEILLVDDGSTDRSGALCEEYAAQDERIRVFHKENGGPSEARNMGIRQANGEYFCFLDSDDLLSERAITILESQCEKENAEIAIGQGKAFTGCLPVFAQDNTFKAETVSREEALRRMFLHQGFGHEAWGKLYRRILWEKVHFPEGMIYEGYAEDYAVVYPIITQSSRVSIVETTLYYYRIHSGSIMHSAIKEKNLGLLDVGEQVTQYMRENVPEVQDEACYLQLVSALKLMKGVLDGGFQNMPQTQERIMILVRSQKRLLARPWAKRADKIKVKTLLLSKRLFYWVYELAERKNARDLRV